MRRSRALVPIISSRDVLVSWSGVVSSPRTQMTRRLGPFVLKFIKESI